MFKKKLFILIIISLINLIIYPPFLIFSPVEAAPLSVSAPHRPGELLVKLKNSSEIYKFKFSSEQELNDIINLYQKNKDVEFVEPNYLYQTSLIPSDILFDSQDYLLTIKAHHAWNLYTGNNRVIIAFLDSGVDINHPDLKNNLWVNNKEIPYNGIDDDENGYTDDINGWDFTLNSSDPRPKLIVPFSETGIKHGTVIAGVATAEGNNKEGISGITWRSQIMSLRVLDGTGTGDTQTVAKAIDYARLQDAQIINLSFVGEGYSQILETAIKKANEAGILVVAAVGNEVHDGVNMDTNPRYPACHNGPNGENWVIGVASVDKNKQKASFSNYGAKCVDISAPGVSIISSVYHDELNTDFSDYYESGWTGTSVSAPQITGAAALIKSLKPNLSLKQLKNIIINSADNIDALNPVFAKQLGTGLLNVYQAISLAIDEIERPDIEVQKIISSPIKNGGPHVRIFKKTQLEQQFFAHDEKFRGGVSVTGGDINGDGQKEIIAALGSGTYPWIKIFQEDGTLKDKIIAFDEKFRGGVEVALGHLDDKPGFEIIAVPQSNGGPHIRIFNGQGQLITQFFAFDKKERTGLNVATGDINADGLDEIIVARKSGLSEVKIFNLNGQLINTFKIDQKKRLTNFNLATGDINADNQTEIIFSSLNNSQIKIFTSQGQPLLEFYPNGKWGGGVTVSTGDIDGDGAVEIITGNNSGGEPLVKTFNTLGQLKNQFYAYDKKFRGGVNVEIIK
ncbi:MAG TPA: S8 family serine peptidase [bacterium]|nr:S8 family serine peptidase [bacterium]